MSRIGTNRRWKKTSEGWRYISDDDDRKVTSRCLESSSEVNSRLFVVWQCVIDYISSPRDLQNLANTCRSLHELVENGLGWSCLIRRKFGQRLWQRHVRETVHSHHNQQINFHADIETMEKMKVIHECSKIPTTFLLNRTGNFTRISRAILRSYRYSLERDISTCIVYEGLSENIFRYLVSFKNIHSEHLKDIQRRTVPLTKLIYFYLADQRHVPVVNFHIIYPRGSAWEMTDLKASTGRALQLHKSGRMILLHSYYSIMAGRYEIFWRLRFISTPLPDQNLEFISVPQYGLMTREHTSSKEFGECLKKYGKDYFRRSMGIITVFKRCIVYVGCIHLTSWQERTTFALDYIEMLPVV